MVSKKTKKDKLGIVKEGGYGLILMTTRVSPIVYKDSLDVMDKLGINNESTLVAMAIKAFNDKHK